MVGVSPEDITCSDTELVKFFLTSTSMTCREISQFLRNHHKVHLTTQRVEYLKLRHGVTKY